LIAALKAVLGGDLPALIKEEDYDEIETFRPVGHDQPLGNPFSDPLLRFHAAFLGTGSSTVGNWAREPIS
jgi:hypothetical protein